MNLKFQLAAIVWIACVGTAIADETPSKLDGVYSIVAGEKNGTEIPADKLMGSVIKFDGETVLGTDKDKKEFFGCTFQIDKTTTPYTISMTSTSPMKGEKAVGIIEVKGDTVKLCYALAGGDAPKEFKTKEKQHCFTLKRVTKTEK